MVAFGAVVAAVPILGAARRAVGLFRDLMGQHMLKGDANTC